MNMPIKFRGFKLGIRPSWNNIPASEVAAKKALKDCSKTLFAQGADVIYTANMEINGITSWGLVVISRRGSKTSLPDKVDVSFRGKELQVPVHQLKTATFKPVNNNIL